MVRDRESWKKPFRVWKSAKEEKEIVFYSISNTSSKLNHIIFKYFSAVFILLIILNMEELHSSSSYGGIYFSSCVFSLFNYIVLFLQFMTFLGLILHIPSISWIFSIYFIFLPKSIKFLIFLPQAFLNFDFYTFPIVTIM